MSLERVPPLGAGMPMDTNRLLVFVPTFPEFEYQYWNGSSKVAIATTVLSAMPFRWL